MSERMSDEAVLVGGPQDGARVKRSGYSLPDVIFVGPKWLGDGFAAWSEEGCERFPVQYSRDFRGSGNFMFDFYVRPTPAAGGWDENQEISPA